MNKKYVVMFAVFLSLSIAGTFFTIGYKLGLRGFSYQENRYKQLGYGDNGYQYNRGRCRDRQRRKCQIGKRFRCRLFAVNGKILSISSSIITVLDRSADERVIDASNAQNFDGIKKISELRINDRIMAIGNPQANGILKVDYLKKIEVSESK